MKNIMIDARVLFISLIAIATLNMASALAENNSATTLVPKSELVPAYQFPVGLIKEYLRNSDGSIIGATLEDGTQARFNYSQPEYLTKRYSPKDGIEIKLLQESQSPASQNLPNRKQGSTVKRSLILQLKNLKTGSTYVPAPRPIP